MRCCTPPTALLTKSHLGESRGVKLREKTLKSKRGNRNDLLGNNQQCVVKVRTQRSGGTERLRQTQENESHRHRMFRPAQKAETEKRALRRAQRTVKDSRERNDKPPSWRRIRKERRKHVKAERQLETSDKKQQNKSTLMDNFRILLEEKHNDADRIRDGTRTKYLKKKTNYR